MLVQEIPGSGLLSSRGREALAPPPEYLQYAFAAWTDSFDPDTNPTGYVDLSVAENRLSLPLVADRLEKAESAPSTFLTYDQMHGSLRFRTAIAALFSRHDFTRTQVSPNHIAVTAGAGSVVDLMATALCEVGDRVLITTPAVRFTLCAHQACGQHCLNTANVPWNHWCVSFSFLPY
jgi:1-aminocyclopropane-1-carboxylate synthase 1/2/6